MSIYCLWLSFYQNDQGKWLEQETRCPTEPEVCPLWPFMKLFTDLSIAWGEGGFLVLMSCGNGAKFSPNR